MENYLRTIGFSSAPGLIRVFGFTPELMSFTFIGAAIWMLVAMVVAVRQALRLSKHMESNRSCCHRFFDPG